MDSEFKEAFKDVVRDQLIQRNKVRVNGLGIFSPMHLSQRKWEYKNGKVVLLPPKDYVEFEETANPSDGDQS